MRRRAFLSGLGALLAVPLAAGAQEAAKTYRIGVMGTSPVRSPDIQRLWDAFADGLRELGYVEGKNLVLERRYSEGRAERFPRMAAELVGLKVDLILVFTTPAALAAKDATATIPILFVTAIDPVGHGLIASWARPGGNVTGIASFPELGTKRLQLLREIAPRIARIAVLWNGANPANAVVLKQTEEAARQLGVLLQPHEVRGPDDLDGRLAMIRQQQPDVLLVLGDVFLYQQGRKIAQFALKARLPSMFEAREMVAAGGLMAYGPNYPDMFRRASIYVDRLLRGVKPADLPFEQATRFEFVINLKAAQALGLTIPPSLLAQADQVIE